MAGTIWSTLRELFQPRPGGPEEEAAALARLLLAEIRLYNPDQVGSIPRLGAVPPPLVAELSRAFGMLAERTDPALARRCFREEAERALCPGQPDLLHSALSQIFDEVSSRRS